MDKNRAFTEIEKILYSKENENISTLEQRIKIQKVLDEMSKYTYELGIRNGIFRSINILKELVEPKKP